MRSVFPQIIHFRVFLGQHFLTLPPFAYATPERLLQVYRRPRTGGRKRKSMDEAARLRVPPGEPAAAAEPPHKRKRKSAPAAKAAAADKGAEQLQEGSHGW